VKDSDFLKDSRALLKKIAKQRNWLVCHNKSQISDSFASQEIKNLNYAISTIKDAETMRRYLLRKHSSLGVLIPSKNKTYHSKLNQLINTELSNF
jgi:hypothetical protein